MLRRPTVAKKKTWI